MAAYLVDERLSVVAWNGQREAGRHGIPRKSALARRLRDVLPSGGEQAELDTRRVFESGSPIESTVLGAAGRTYRCSRLPVLGRHRVTHVASIFADITDELRSVAAIEESGERYRLLFLQSALPMWVEDAESSHIIDVNEAAVVYYGYSRDEFLRLRAADVAPGGSIPGPARPGSPSESTLAIHRHRDGVESKVFVSANPIELRGRAARLIAVQDLSELEAAEQALWERTEQLQAVADAMLVYVANADVHEAASVLLKAASRASQSPCGAFGYRDESGALRWLASFGPGAGAAPNLELPASSVARLAARVAADGLASQSEDEPAAEPALDWLGPSLAVPIPGGDLPLGVLCVGGRPGGYGSVERAIAQTFANVGGGLCQAHRRKQQQQDLELRLRGAEKLQALGLLAGGVAHDFNNILGVILGHCELLAASFDDASVEARRTQKILTAVERARALTGQLLAFGRTQEAGPATLDVNARVRDMAGMLTRLIGERVRLATHLAPDLGSVAIEGSQLEQVLMNLIINARDALPAGGQISVTTRNVELGADTASEPARWSPGPYVVLEVADEGVGIEPTALARLFEPFFTTKPGPRGTGLGLATVSQIVKRAGGHIDVWSVPGQGSRFTVQLPRSARAAVTPRSLSVQAAPPRTAATGAGILLVEDELSLRVIVKELLEAAGYTVFDYGTPSEALTFARSHGGRIDLVVTDMVLPEIGGRELARQIYELRDEKPPALYVSGYPGDMRGDDAGGVPESDFVQKPFREEALLSSVAALLARRTAPGERRGSA